MFDNVAFEVVIGLIFIYLLYSLLVTILSEMIATWLGIRARLLRAAIERMLNDGYYYKIEKKKEEGDKVAGSPTNPDKELLWLRGPELKEHPEFRQSFAGKFYDYPAIKYLGRIEKEKEGKLTLSKASYISADYFADSLINFLADKGEGKTLMDKISFCLKFNTYHIQYNTLRQFKNLYESAATLDVYKANLMKWYDETMDRATGWHKRKLKWISFFLGLVLAMIFNVDTIQIAKILANDKEARRELVNMGVALAKDSARYKTFVIDGGDTLRNQAILDTGFARVKNDINKAGLVLGLGWDLDNLTVDGKFAVDSNDANKLQYIDSLQNLIARDRIIAAKLYSLSVALVNNKQQLDSLYADTVIASKEMIIAKSFPPLLEPSPDTVKQSADTLSRVKVPTKPVIDTAKRSLILNAAAQRYSADTNRATLLSLNRSVILSNILQDSASLKANHFLTTLLYDKINKMSGKNFIAIDSISQPDDKNVRYIHGKEKAEWYDKLFHVLITLFCHNIIGFFITALALSLGAPFWFDMLNKIVSIRNVGIKPEEKKPLLSKADVIAATDNKATHKTTTVTTVVDQSELALNELTVILKKETGIVGITLVAVVPVHLLVAAESAAIVSYLQNKYGSFLKLASGYSIPVKYEIELPVITHGGSIGAGIRNEAGVFEPGTLGCFLRKQGSSSHFILSCWHVMKDVRPFGSQVILQKKILETNAAGSDVHIANVVDGFISDCVDAGIAECLDKTIVATPGFVIETQHKTLTAFDEAMQTPVVLYGKVCKRKEARIFHYKSNVKPKYPDGNVYELNDVFSITVEDANGAFTAPTSPGDSGALVMDTAGSPLGMIIGGNASFSYAVKFSNMFDTGRVLQNYFFHINA